MCHVIGALIVGAVAGTAAPRPKGWRPMVRGIVKSGIIAKRRIESAGVTVAAEARKIADEARLELDQAEMEQHS
jgi:hypothetical protein